MSVCPPPASGSSGHVLPEFPESVRRIAEEAARFAASEARRAETHMIWERETAHIRVMLPGVLVEDDAETVRIGELSPGCLACKSGTWDCVFVTMDCNLNCPFCLRPDGAGSVAPSGAFGSDPAVALEHYAKAGVTGVSFSGGEPFLEPDTVLRWVRMLRSVFPDMYLWAYTNGVLITTELLCRLADAGLDELRFDLAATGYRDPAVLRALRKAVTVLPAVTVEVPAIPADREALIGSLGVWAESGVRYLNLHELVYEPGSASGRMAGARVPRTMPDGHVCEADPGSAGLIREVLGYVCAEGLPFGVNDCSLRNKARQMRGRRAMLAPFTVRPHELLREDGYAKSAIVFNRNEVLSVSSAEWRSVLAGHGPGWGAARLLRLLPLDIAGRGQWIGFQLCDPRGFAQ